MGVVWEKYSYIFSFSNQNEDGDGDSKTCKKTGENAVLAGISKQLSSHYKMPLMMSLKEVGNQLLISQDDGVINDEELYSCMI